MDDQQIEQALRAGPVDEPRYTPSGRPVSVPVGRPMLRRLGAVLELAATAALIVAFVAGMLFIRGGSETGAVPDLLATLHAAGRIRIAVTTGSPQVRSPGSGLDGFDLDVARAIGQRLGLAVEIDAVDPAVIEAGGWGGHWDLAIDSAVSTNRRAATLLVGSPYYARSAALVVTDGSSIRDLAGLAGARVCTVRGSLAERWADGTLDLAGTTAAAVPAQLQTVSADSSSACLAAVGDGSATAFVADWVEEVNPSRAGLTTLAQVPFTGIVAPAADPAIPGSDALLAEVDRVVAALRADGTLRSLSERRFGGRDLTILPGN